MATSDPATHLSQGRFHRSIVCPRTRQRVSFALVGQWDDDADIDAIKQPLPAKSQCVLFIPPSGCSRFMGIQLDGIARKCRVSLVAIDRPGTGAVPSIPADQRMRASTNHVLSVIEALQIHKVEILTHSAGWLYVLELMCQRPTLASRATFLSPFVPTHLSSSLLSWLPGSIVGFAPKAFDLLRSCEKPIAWSIATFQHGTDALVPASGNEGQSGAQQAQQKKKRAQKREESMKRYPKAKFHPPYDAHHALLLEQGCKNATHPTTKRPVKSGMALLLDYFTEERGVHAATQDFLFCLGKNPDMNSRQLETWIQERLQQLKRSDPHVRFVWGSGDLLTPQKGRDHLLSMFQLAGIRVDEWVMAGGGHDDTLIAQTVMTAVFEELAGS
ncbi:unnamed protein product [Jaminaea pallidilutea]